jgi:dihydrolipoamide dehydrogenase
MENKYDYDVVVIGAGPGGYVAAIRASQLGLKACVIEKDKPGGVCLNIGCIPSKAIIHQADLFRSIGELEGMGIETDSSKFDYGNVFKKSRKAADTLSRGVSYLLKKNSIDLIKGTGTIKSPQEVSLEDGKVVSGKHIIVATGSRPRAIPGFEYDEKRVLSSNGALMLQKLPKSILILGGGYIGVEFAHIMNAFDIEVYIVELLDRLLPIEDQETAAVLERSFKKRKMKIHTATEAQSLEKKGNLLSVEIKPREGDKSVIDVEMVLVVVGRAPNTENIGLENIGIETEKGFIPVGDYYQTKVPSVFAIGDVVASPQLAHVASKEGEIAAEFIAGHETIPRIDPSLIPSGTYCEPQVASFGMTEEQAVTEGIPFKKAVFPYRGAGKSVAVEKSEGLVKILYDAETSEILGAHIAGLDATELIHELLLAKSSELLPSDIAGMIHAHPTLSEAVMESARSVGGWAIHI